MRIKRGNIRTRKRARVLEHTRGFMWRRKNVYRIAKEAMRHSLANMYIGRKQRKRSMRRLWITQINAAARQEGMTYGQLMHALKEKNVGLNRKQLAVLARSEPETFKKVLETVKK